MHRRVGVTHWDKPHAVLERQTARLLDLLDELDARATFFLLGMSVANHQDLVAEIVQRGHEPASHGYTHARVYDQTRDEFRADVERATEMITAAAGQRPVAYRAPAFSINRRTPWAYDVLAEAGFLYDSSQYDSPRVPDRLGDIPDRAVSAGRPVGAAGRRRRQLLATPPAARNLREHRRSSTSIPTSSARASEPSCHGGRRRSSASQLQRSSSGGTRAEASWRSVCARSRRPIASSRTIRRMATSTDSTGRVREHFRRKAFSFDHLYDEEHALQRTLRPGLFNRREFALEIVRRIRRATRAGRGRRLRAHRRAGARPRRVALCGRRPLGLDARACPRSGSTASRTRRSL